LPEGRLTQPHRLLEHRVEHGGEIAHRGVDYLQHLSGRGLPLQGLGKFSLTFGKLPLQIGYELLGVG
jgi:hypothetical protein